VSGDYTRFTFKPRNRFSGVLQQQGRVQLDSDWNEAVDIFKHRLELQALDTFGPVGVPFLTTKDAFKVSTIAGDIAIEPGRLYVDGLLVEAFAGEDLTYLHQPFFPDPDPEAVPNGSLVAYLDVWEREVTYVEDPALLDVALGGVDTATRTQTVWQLRVEKRETAKCGDTVGKPASDGVLSTDAVKPPPPDDPCLLPPLSGYRGIENRLYRVEIHKGGALGTAMFKWSRDNGSIVSPVTDISVGGGKTTLTVKLIGRDQFLRFRKFDWVTLTDDHRELHGEAGEIAFIDDIKEADNLIILTGTFPTVGARAFGATPDEIVSRHTRIQRWDQKEDINTLVGGLMTTGAGPISIEEGITVSFDTNSGGNFNVGDYWVFWARTATASVEILDRAPPRGIKHHYVQLAAITGFGSEDPEVEDCRPKPDSCKCSCCLITVGTSTDHLGDFATLAEAVAALPTVAPDTSVPVIICLEPGNHAVKETVTVSRARTTIRGCGFGSRLTGDVGPLVRLAGQEQALEHLSAVNETSGPTVEVTGEKIRIERCRIRNFASGPAIASDDADMVEILGCEIIGHGGLALGGTRLDVVDNLVMGGPVLVRDLSSLVRIRDNKIVGSATNGVTLGEKDLVFLVEIERNLIDRAAAIGIATGHELDATTGEGVGTGVIGLVIDGNQIQFCDGNAYKWNAGLPPAGGIALSRADKVSITGNRVTSNGIKAAAPVCGLWIGKSRGVVIRENWIEGNQPAPGAETLAATQGGVRLEEAWVAIAAKDAKENISLTVGISPAVDISGNFIDAPFGHAVYVIGEGAMVIRDNRLKSYGALNMELKTPATGFEELGRSYSSVLVFNYGYPAMFSVFLQAFGHQFAAGDLKATPGPALRRALSGGQIRFAGNQIRLDLRDPDTSFVPANIGIFTLDDCLFAHNQTEGLINVGPNTIDVIFFDVLIGAVLSRQTGNGLFTTPFLTLISLASIALFNHCLDNQATSCILPFGVKVSKEHNRVLAPSAFCQDANPDDL
jgi:hypothetical protein